ncbi:penicillin acylase family protein [Thalassomonas actiniarum]|uniref:Penicillin acylase family protein n=1 Tax=Thalassomonas actiniarum TaxID=485447 RepID=A0AAE9YSD4_9GAMM|nr:penicillin acylase family protein [Thalassomonas actiniarum]WDE00355.1 penicillin acylase family protein [Thalassomonas actiniarum]
MKKYKNILLGCTLVLFFVFATAFTWLYSQINSALPMLDGKADIFGLSGTTVIERDENGIATIKGEQRNDVAVALGFVHAQERFFQMDLLRRNSAGELSSLFGPAALKHDKKIRRHRFRERAREIIKHLPPPQLNLLKAYTRGVNQGLELLKAAPFEYLLLQQEPVFWQEEDTVLTIFSMYVDLQFEYGERELTLGMIKNTLGNDIYQFLNPKGSRWDAAIDNSRYPESAIPTQGWQANSTATHSGQAQANNSLYRDQALPGSNNWAVSGKLSENGSAILANDMHLNLRVPNTWYRASLEYRNHENQAVKVTGVSLPGAPSIIAGSNGDIAWGFTNSYGDWSDVILLETNEDNSQYLTPDGYLPFTTHKQVIAVKDQQSVEISVRDTIWGPVIGENYQGQMIAYRWVAHDLNAVNLNLTELEQAKNTDQAFAIAATSGIPAQNMVVADKAGNIGWTIMGPIPVKHGDIGDVPANWATGENSWSGYLPPDLYPKIKNPESNRLWTANSRVVGGEMLDKIGNGGYALGARASQIRDNLREKSRFNEQDLLDIALDHRAKFLDRWQDFLLNRVLTPATLAKHSQWQQVKTLLDNKVLKATTDSVAYRLVRNFRLNVKNQLFEGINNQLAAADNGKAYDTYVIRHQLEIPLWQLITKQPLAYLPPSTSSWQGLFEQALAKTVEDMTADQALEDATWGQQNTAQIRHPLSRAVPAIGYFLDMPATELAGDKYMPHVQNNTFGASERMVVAPGFEHQGILHMPTSQSGHPWSPYYGKGHDDWVKGKVSPFLPGKTKYILTLSNY